MIGYTPAEQDIRASRGQPPDAGHDDPALWHDQQRAQLEAAVTA